MQRYLAEAPEDLRTLHQFCREGRLYDVERWVAEGKALQLAPEAVPKGRRPRTALQIALETGQHSLVSLLLKNGYRLEFERYAPLDLALHARRWDLFDLLLDLGKDGLLARNKRGAVDKPGHRPGLGLSTKTWALSGVERT